MEKVTRWVFVWLFACGSPAESSRPAPPPCPVAGETAADCPWAGVAREAATDPRVALQRDAPTIVAELSRDAKAPAVLATWGLALNYNQKPDGSFGADPIVAPAIVDELSSLAGVAPRRDRVVHAGVQHTYGYLFSVLATPYGFKRARWVQRTIDNGFGLPDGTIAPVAVAGTLLGNVTWLAGSIAFAGEPELGAARSDLSIVSPALQALDISALHIKRLSETVSVAGRTVVLRTDFVELPHPSPDATTLLVYSIRDGATSRLVTMFPINAKSRDTYEGVPLGDQIPITTQYNAWVDGLTGTTIPGNRQLH